MTGKILSKSIFSLPTALCLLNGHHFLNFPTNLDVSVKDFADAAISSKKVRIRKHVGKTMTLEQNFEALDIEYPEAPTKPVEKSTEFDDANNNHITYPNEVWFLISEQIQPEDVGRFAMICKQTYHITTTMKFWRNLYLRYYDGDIEMPVRLQKDCMMRPGGIRACTIRSLFYTYPLFVDRLIPSYSQDTNAVLNRRVVNYWYLQLGPEQYRFFYILKRPLVPGSNTYQSDQLQRQDEKSLASLRDIYSNSDEGCSILIVRIAEKTFFAPKLKLSQFECFSVFFRSNQKVFNYYLD